MDNYAKIGELSKPFDGYDGQPITWIDDPVSLSCFRTGDEESVQRFKTVISYGKTLVEVKHGPWCLIGGLCDNSDKLIIVWYSYYTIR